VKLGQLLPEFAFALGQFFRNLNLRHDKEITAPSRSRWKSVAA
jgi:hypothetical protein